MNFLDLFALKLREKRIQQNARYAEFKNTGEGADASGRVKWAKQLTDKEAVQYTPQNIFKECSNWYPYK